MQKERSKRLWKIIRACNFQQIKQKIEKAQEYKKAIKASTIQRLLKCCPNFLGCFDEDDLDRMNSKYLKDLPFDVLKKHFDIDCDKKFWEFIKKNIEKIDEVEEWKEIILNGTDLKVSVSPELLESIKKFIPNEINEKSWKIWTDKILEESIIKPKELFVTIRLLLTGKKFGPSMNELLTLLERKEIFKRIEDNSGK